MQSWGAAVDVSGGMNGKSLKVALYPTWLLAMPLRLTVHQGLPQHQGPLTLLAGPQRLEAGWLEGDAALRDYYVARSSTAGLLWVYRERLGGQAMGEPARWYLQGIFA
jgi:protein ImuB